jgi:hypothetical protein
MPNVAISSSDVTWKKKGFRRRGVFSTEILTGILFHRKWTSHLPKLVFVLPKFTAKIAELDIFSAENVF